MKTMDGNNAAAMGIVSLYRSRCYLSYHTVLSYG